MFANRYMLQYLLSMVTCVHSPLSNSSYTEVLDGTRIHPETYEWARKMAVDALEIDDVRLDDGTAIICTIILSLP